jgi:uncharacterized protein (TIGR03790 family)
MPFWKHALRGLFAAATLSPLLAQGPGNVLVVVNNDSSLSKSIGAYYAAKRGIPSRNICRIRVTDAEYIERSVYDRDILRPVADCLKKQKLVEDILYIVTTMGVPLRVDGSAGLQGDVAAVDSELALLYADIKSGRPHPVAGQIQNPFFGKSTATFQHPEFPMYLVTRLAAYDLAGVRALIDRALAAQNRGRFVVDMSDDNDAEGNNWLRNAAIRLPADRVVFDASTKVVIGQTDVIGYAAWGSNDRERHTRFTGFKWLPGAIATEFVSTNARTFSRPPKDWTISDWSSPAKWFTGSPQSMTADYLEEGASAATGHVAEPYLHLTPRPDLLLPAYFQGRSLAESFYLSIPALSWQNVIIGDPLMTLGPPGK